MHNIHLYAEVLTHLRQLTLNATLQTEKDESTSFDISSDKRTVTLSHNGESVRLCLPTQISSTAKVTSSSATKEEVSTRVQIDDLDRWKETDATGIEAPWNASDLSSETAIACAQCDVEILSPGRVSAWKDLPNQNWADIMDLWFCHKPHEGRDSEQQKDAAKAKGWSGQSRLASISGVGLVDLVSFALHPKDCKDVTITTPKMKNTLIPVPVRCPRCSFQIGVFSVHDNLVRLDKSSMKVRTAQDNPFINYSPATFMASQLLELIESTALRKVVVYTQPAETSHKDSMLLAEDNHALDQSNKPSDEVAGEEPLTRPTTSSRTVSNTTAQGSIEKLETNREPEPFLLWIFNPDIYYYSSSPPQISPPQPSSTHTLLPPPLFPHRALKIFYTSLPSASLHEYLSPRLSSQYEPLPLSPTSLASLYTTLQNSTFLLPVAARTFKNNEHEWRVGLLDRWERHTVSERVGRHGK